MADITEDTKYPSTSEAWVWGAIVVIGALIVPGLGMATGLVLAFTRLRRARPLLRWGLVALGTLILCAQLVGLVAGGVSTQVSPVEPAQT